MYFFNKEKTIYSNVKKFTRGYHDLNHKNVLISPNIAYQINSN